MAVILVGTLDTKGAEVRFVRDRLQMAGLDTLVIDAGVLSAAVFPADISASDVFAAAGARLEAVRSAGDRGRAVELAARGVASIVRGLHSERKVDGIFGLGGSAGTTIAAAAMQALPFGIPKMLVSTLASGQVKPYVGVRDICMMHSVVDISGLNRFSTSVLTRATGALVGMIHYGGANQFFATLGGDGQKPVVTATMFGVTTPCVEVARSVVEGGGYEVLVFHATGTGGTTMESLIADGLVRGVLDLTTTELADELVGGELSAGPARLTAAALRGVPQVISLGALDMVNFGPRSTVPEKFKERLFYQHNPNVTLMRTTPRENDMLGREIAQKASAAKGPTAVLVPLKGVSAIDREGQPFWFPEADRALFQSLRDWMAPQVRLIELDLHINDREFAETAARTLLEMM
jgi:uncharacterized protein (UPF0261 family)